MFLLWMGDQISAKGIGNGVSMIIFAGIVSNFPAQFTSAYNALCTRLKVHLPTECVLFGLILFVIRYHYRICYVDE